MRLTVLGCGAAYPRPGGACSGYLVEGGGVRVWIDAGNGTLSNLTRSHSLREIDALVVTHRHADHIADVIPLMYARAHDESVERPLPLYAPTEVVGAVLANHGPFTVATFHGVFDVRDIAGAFDVGGLLLDPFRTVHPVVTYGLRVSDGASTLVYSADTATHPELPDECRDANVLLCEATYARGTAGAPEMHLFAHEAGEVAAKADVGKLVLTHVWPTIELAQSVDEATESYGGPIETAAEGAVLSIS